jgi:hypothetical protein
MASIGIAPDSLIVHSTAAVASIESAMTGAVAGL